MTTTTTVTIAPPKPPHPHLFQKPQAQQHSFRRASHNNNNNNCKCHRNCCHCCSSLQRPVNVNRGDQDRNNTKGGLCVMIPEGQEIAVGGGGEKSKRNWVLSENFYLLESPKTWRSNSCHFNGAKLSDVGMTNVSGNGGSARNRTESSVGKYGSKGVDVNLSSKSNERCKARYGDQLSLQQPPPLIGSNSLHRSWKNLLDFREGDKRISDPVSADEVMKCSIELRAAEKGGSVGGHQIHSNSRTEGNRRAGEGDKERCSTDSVNSDRIGGATAAAVAAAITMTTVDGNHLRKSSSAAVVVPSSSSSSSGGGGTMDHNWLSSSLGSGGAGFLPSTGLTLENSASATEIGGGGGGRISSGSVTISSDIQQHLQSMFHVLRPEETLKMAVKLESARAGRTRYLVVVSRSIRQRRRSQCSVGNKSAAPLNQSSSSTMEESDDSKDSGRLSQDEGVLLLEEGSEKKTVMQTTETSDNGITFNKRSSNGAHFGEEESDRPAMEEGGGIDDLDRGMATDCGYDTAWAAEEDQEESCLLGIDCNEVSTVGLVLRIYADTKIHLDGDGGFSVSVCGRTHIFKPVSVQTMWSALQTLHKVSSKARENNYFEGGPSHLWSEYYEEHIGSDQSCINEWFAMDSLESRRPPSPDTVRNKPTAREETEVVIRTSLKEIIMSVDLDEVTSKYIRGRLEEHLDMDLNEYKSFIDEEMLVILGQMDVPTEIFEHVYLGSEWNASNLEELQRNGVGHILNVTREIDNFFPGLFDYFNIRVYDEETTDLLKYWDNTFKYITKARLAGSKVLVHCKMGVSRSASVVIAYAMKENKWDFRRALQHVKDKRNCIKPNKGFTAQLETYQGILAAMRNKEKLQRSKSETNLKSSSSGKDARLLPGSEPTPLIQALNGKQRNVYSTYRRYQSSSLKAGHLKRTCCEQSTVVCDSSTVATKEEKKLQEDQQTLTEFLRQNDAAKEEQEEAVAAAVEEKQRRLESNRQFMKNLNIIVRGKKEQQRKYIRNAEREESLKTRPRSWSQQFGHLDGAGMRIGVGFPMAPVRQLSQSLENLLVVDKRTKGRRKRGEDGQTSRSSSSNNSSSGNNSDSSSTNAGAKRGRRAGSSWKFSKTTKTVRLPCSNGQNYSVSQNKIVHLTPESNNSNTSFLASFVGGGSPGNSHNKSLVDDSGGGDQDEPEEEGEVTLRRRNLSSTSVRLIVNEIESSNGPSPVVLATSTGTMGRGQRDKKAMSLNLSGGKEDGVPEKSKSVSKVILKCDSSPIINLQVREGEVYDPPPTVMIVESGGDKEKRPKKMRMDTTDAFSKTVDRVFDREEKKQARNSVLLENQVPMTTTSTTTVTLNALTGKDCLISRQSSWSSVDSACVMGGYPSESNLRDLPSRHSSWGSGDTRTTPSRNSSWGSYDMRTNPMSLPKSGGTCLEEDGDGTMEQQQQQLTGHEDVPWHPGTVRRTKQKIEAREKNKTTASGGGGQQPPVKMRSWGRTLSISGSSGESSSRSLSEEALLAKSKRNTICGESGGALLICPPAYSEQLSVSAPSSSTSNSSCCSTYTAVNLRDGGSCCAAAEDLDMMMTGGGGEDGEGDEGSMPPAATGMVQNLKMNFENHHILMSGGDEEESLGRKVTCRSLPSSPVEIKREEFLLLPLDGGLARRQQGFIVSSSSSEEEEQQQQEKQRQQQQRVEKKNVKNLVGRYETTKVQLRSPDVRKGGAGMRQRPKSQIIMDRRPMGGGMGGGGGGGGAFVGQLSATMPNSPAQRKNSPFSFNVSSQVNSASAFGRPLMMTHNKISMKGMNSIYNDNSSSAGGQGGGGKMKATSPRPPPVPVVGMGVGTGQKNVLGNRMNVNHSNHQAEKGGGVGGVASSGNSGAGGSFKGFGLKKAPGQQQQGKTHPLTKLSFAYRQH